MQGISKKYRNGGWPFELGYIILPSSISEDARKKYINTCYRKKKVSILLRDGGVAHNCPIPKYLLREIFFPKEFRQVGSSVLLYIHPFYNSPMIVALYEKENDADFSEEFEKRMQSLNGGNLAEIITRGKNGEIMLNVDSDQEDGGVISITIANKNRAGKLNLSVLGTSDIYVSGKTSLYSNSEVDLRVEDLDNEEVSSINVKGSKIILNDNRLDSFMADINASTERYNLIEEKVNDIIEIIRDLWTPITTDGGAALKTLFTTPPMEDLIQTDVDDIKDDKILN